MGEKQKIRKLFGNGESFIVIIDGKMYVLDPYKKGYSDKSITVMPGFQIELGRNINDIKTALGYTRLPIALELSVNVGSMAQYTVVRMQTGTVSTHNIATIKCVNDIIEGVSFYGYILKDKHYRKKVGVSILRQLALAVDTNGKTRVEQVTETLKVVRFTSEKDISVVETASSISAVINTKGKDIKFTFLIDTERNNQFVLSNISLVN
mgnify:FL=1